MHIFNGLNTNSSCIHSLTSLIYTPFIQQGRVPLLLLRFLHLRLRSLRPPVPTYQEEGVHPQIEEEGRELVARVAVVPQQDLHGQLLCVNM